MECRVSKILMGCAFELIVCDKHKEKAEENLTLGIRKIRKLEEELSEFAADSYTSMINKNAGIKPVKVNPETYELIERSLKISGLTQGAFDISTSPLKKLYAFKNKTIFFPNKNQIKNTLKKVGFQYIRLNKNESTVFLTKKGMRISFAAIGKGYAADCVKKMWKNNNIRSALINASGDISTIGEKEKNKPWQIAIPNPDRQKEILFVVPISNIAVATSGNYEQFFMHNGKKYGHNIHPKTGLPIQGIKSVSVFSPSAELSDALATAVYVLGIDAGIDFINQLPSTDCILIDLKNKAHFSNTINYSNEV